MVVQLFPGEERVVAERRKGRVRGESGEGEAIGVGIGLDWVVALFDEIGRRELWGVNGVIERWDWGMNLGDEFER